MTPRTLFSIIESPAHPDFSALYRRLGFEEVRLTSQRKAIAELKRRTPDFVVAEFFYTFNTYYQAVNISNLDVLLNSLVKYAPAARVIVLVSAAERQHVDALNAILPLHGVLVQPVEAAELEALLNS